MIFPALGALLGSSLFTSLLAGLATQIISSVVLDAISGDDDEFKPESVQKAVEPVKVEADTSKEAKEATAQQADRDKRLSVKRHKKARTDDSKDTAADVLEVTEEDFKV